MIVDRKKRRKKKKWKEIKNNAYLIKAKFCQSLVNMMNLFHIQLLFLILVHTVT